MASRDEKQAVETPSAGSSNGSAETFCPICGRDAADPSLKRFGEYFCSEAHVAEYARETRSKQATETTAIATVAGADVTTSQNTGTLEPGQAPQKKGGIGGLLKMAACCGLPLLALVFLAGGGGAVLGAAGAVLPFLLFLACPIGMYFMMRGMKQEKHAGHEPDANTDRKELAPKGPGPSA